ncbi:DUF5763 domain-containing protein [uncultured Psychroserpens sp.]|uniref:DUF5763 domain-containing protein n=1 Tax=uncultured Psychroserpens sp. TaxID=255436 RepID=UPI0026141692|nr:DUF5763 domain-containing protein [uncultured Psychroserpens sp.]
MKYCKSITKNKTRCLRKSYLFGYCKQHLKVQIKKKRKYIWGLVVLVFLIAGGYQDLIKPIINSFKTPDFIYCEADNKVRGVIKGTPRLKNLKTLPLNLGIKDQKIKLLLEYDKNGKKKCFNPYNELFKYYCPFSYRIDKDGYFYFNMTVVDYNTNSVGQIKDNEFVLNQDCNFSWNMDNNGFEVVDSNYNVVFSIDFSKKGEASIQGLFYDGARFIIIGSDFIGFAKNLDELFEDQARLTKIFKYVGNDYFETRQ